MRLTVARGTWPWRPSGRFDTCWLAAGQAAPSPAQVIVSSGPQSERQMENISSLFSVQSSLETQPFPATCSGGVPFNLLIIFYNN